MIIVTTSDSIHRRKFSTLQAACEFIEVESGKGFVCSMRVDNLLYDHELLEEWGNSLHIKVTGHDLKALMGELLFPTLPLTYDVLSILDKKWNVSKP